MVFGVRNCGPVQKRRDNATRPPEQIYSRCGFIQPWISAARLHYDQVILADIINSYN